MAVRWVTAFLDLPSQLAGPATEFWLAVTGYSLSPRRGKRQEFATLVPAAGDAFLRMQTVWDGPGGCHLDLHVDDPDTGAMHALACGASITHAEDGLVVLRSPGGLSWCLVRHHGESARPAPVLWPDGGRSLVDQVCLDIPPSRYDAECAFWSELTGWPRRHGSRPEFDYLARPDGIPIRLLLQRLDTEAPATRAHLDLACDDVPAEVRRHLALGASFIRETPGWTTLRDPAGTSYCVTTRDPATGTLPT